MVALVLALIVLLAGVGAGWGAGGPDAWALLEPGLEFGVFTAPRASAAGDSRIRILRIDPARFELLLLNASASPEGRGKTPREWAKGEGLVAVINASMYQGDYRSSVSLMRTRTHTNNPHVSKDNTVLVFDPLQDGAPPVQIVDRTCQDFDSERLRYGTLVQSIRMVSCGRKNVWQKRSEEWSTAAIGLDDRQRVLFIHVRSPYPTHDLINMLLALPIGLQTAMYVEGGPQAQLYVEGGGKTWELVGTHGSAFALDGGIVGASPLPNVIGVRRRPAPVSAN